MVAALGVTVDNVIVMPSYCRHRMIRMHGHKTHSNMTSQKQLIRVLLPLTCTAWQVLMQESRAMRVSIYGMLKVPCAVSGNRLALMLVQ